MVNFTNTFICIHSVIFDCYPMIAAAFIFFNLDYRLFKKIFVTSIAILFFYILSLRLDFLLKFFNHSGFSLKRTKLFIGFQ